jgi:molecular chaperone IbpA
MPSGSQLQLAEKENDMVRKYTTADVGKIFEEMKTYTVGFDRVLDNLANVSELGCNYPPYNIVKKDSDNFVIEIAAAGFTEDEFNIHVVPEGNKLVVQGVQDRGEDQQEYYHKGIAARNFTRTFALAEGVQVEGADFVNGMLLVSLHRVIPEEKKLIEIKVNTTPQLLQERNENNT